MTHNTLCGLGQLLRSWWQVDRVRVASPTGRLIQLAPGNRVLIHEQLYLVRTRSILQRAAEADTNASPALGVEYRLINLCDGARDGEAWRSDKVVVNAEYDWRLQVLLPTDGQPSLYRLWIGETMDELLEEEVVVLGAA